MSKVASIIANIKNQHIGATGKRALIVEGVDDKEAFQAFLRKKNLAWDQRWVVEPANGKSRVLEILALEPEWMGVVDRDEWTDEEAAQAALTHGNLFVLPRFCVESYLVDPDDVWNALPPKQRDKIEDGAATLRAEIEAKLEDWRRHAALWHVIHPIYRHMRSADHRDSLLDPTHVPDNIELAEVVTQWLSRFDAARISDEVNDKCNAYARMPPADFYCQQLYAKKFYAMVVHRVLDKLLGQKPDKDRWKALLRTMSLPGDLAPLWRRMGV